MNAVVTGGAGFIGSHLTKKLLDAGWNVIVIDNLKSGYKHNVPSGAEFLHIDLTKTDHINKIPKNDINVVFHLASHVGQQLSLKIQSMIFKLMHFLLFYY